MFRRYSAEFVGTFVLVLFGCGSAAISGGIEGVLGVLGIALAFGLSIVAMAYAIGHVSGCHINPAVSLAMLLTGNMGLQDFVGYVIAQVLGAIAAAGVLSAIIGGSTLDVATSGLGANGYGELSYVGLSLGGALLVEVILTMVFILAIFGATSREETAPLSGLIIGLTLAFVHILGIPLTGTSVNPARSLGPALFTGGAALAQVWVFVLAPLVGAALAAALWGVFRPQRPAVEAG